MNPIYRCVRHASTCAWITALILSSQQVDGAPLTWDPNGAAAGSGGNGNWDTTTPNWNNGAATWNSTTPDQAIFSDANAGTFTVNLTQPITATDIQFSSNSNYTLQGSALSLVNGNVNVSGTGRLTLGLSLNPLSAVGVEKQGTGTLSLTGVNTYTGATTISAGVLEVSDLANGGLAGSLGTSSNAAANLNISSGATLRYVGTGPATLDRNFTAPGGLSNTLGAAIESSGTGPLTWTGSMVISGVSGIGNEYLRLGGTNTGNNVASGLMLDTEVVPGATYFTHGLIKDGPGLWAITADNNAQAFGFTQTTNLNGGVLRLDNAGALTGGLGVVSSHGAVGSSERSTLINFNGGVLGLTAASGDFSRALTAAGAALISRNGTGTQDDDSYTQGVRWTGDGGFAAYGQNMSVNLGGARAPVAWGANGFVPEGSTLILGDAAASATIDFQNPIDLGTLPQQTVLVPRGTGSGPDAILSGALSGAPGLIKSGDGVLALSADNSYAGDTTISAGTLQVGNAGTSGTLGTGRVIIASGATLAFNRSDAISVPSTLLGSGTLAQIGAGTTILTAPSNSVDATMVSNGTLSVSNDLTSNTLQMGNGTLSIDGTYRTDAGGPVTASGIPGTAGTLRVNAGGLMRVIGDLGDGADTLIVAGTLDSAGTLSLGDGNDRFELNPGGVIAPTTSVNGGPGTDAFVLTGSTPATFDVSRLDHGIDSFEDLRKEGSGTWTLTGTGAPTQNWTIAQGTLVGDTLSLQGNIANQAELVFDQASDGTYGAILSGSGNMTKSGAGMLDLTGASTMSGSTTVAQGRLQVSGSIASPVNVNAGAELGGSGLIRASVTNAGSVSPGTAAQMGTLTLQGNYASNGGQLNIRAVVAGDASASDRLLIDGGRASGQTQVNITNQGGAGALTAGNGIQIVGMSNGAGSAADAFKLGGPVVLGPFQYDLAQGAVTGGDTQSWFLRSRDNRPTSVPVPAGALDPGSVATTAGFVRREVAAASPEVSLNNSLGSMVQLYGVQSLNTLAARRSGDADPEVRRHGTRYWTGGFGTQGQVDGGGLQARGADFDYHSAGLQVGADTDILQNDDAVENRVGGYVGAGTFRSDVSHFDGTPAGRSSLKAYSVGVYWNRTSADGWYLEGVGQYTRYDKVEFASVQGIHGQTSGQGIAASIEGGKSMALNENWRIEPQAQLVVQRTSLDDMRDSQNNTASLGSSDSVLGRLGARLVHKWDAANSVWLRTDAWHEFSGKSGATYQTISGPLSYKADLGGSWGELSVGASAWVTPSILIQGSVGYQRNLGGIRREATNLGGSVSAGGAPTAGVGLSVQLTPNAKLTTKVSYANGPKGSVDGGVSANVGLEAKW